MFRLWAAPKPNYFIYLKHTPGERFKNKDQRYTHTVHQKSVDLKAKKKKKKNTWEKRSLVTWCSPITAADRFKSYIIRNLKFLG